MSVGRSHWEVKKDSSSDLPCLLKLIMEAKLEGKRRIELQLAHLKSLRDDGLLPIEIYLNATKLAAEKYLNSAANYRSGAPLTSPPPPLPPPTSRPAAATTTTTTTLHRKPSVSRLQNDALWTYGVPLVFLLLAIIFTLIVIDWVLGVDQPRLLDYMLNPISTCSTHRTGRVELWIFSFQLV